MPLTQEEVIWGFRLILGRDPESEASVRAHIDLPDVTALAAILLRSPEFGASPRFKEFLQVREFSEEAIDISHPHEARAKLRVTLMGNCQVSTVGRLMQAMTGDIVAQSIETTPSVLKRIESGEFDLETVLEGADLVFVQLVDTITQAIKLRYPAHFHKLRQFPILNFAAFHPDCVYVKYQDGGYLQGPMGDYHSSITFWAWNQGWSIQEALALFRPEVYDMLGFHEYAVSSQQMLLRHGELSGIQMEPLLHGWRRRGCWMHTINHPRLSALADLTAELLRREGIDPITGVERWLEDTLARFPVWPMYPPIAKRLGCEGSYLFKIDRGGCTHWQPVITLSLEDFVRASFECYQAEGVGKLICDRLQSAPYAGLAAWRSISPALATDVPSDLVQSAQPTPNRPESAMGNPYSGLPDHHFWRRVMEQTPSSEVDPVLRARWKIGRNDKVATAGSCFAQHISRALSHNGFQFLLTEAGEELIEQERIERQFGIFSARYGNLYTARQLVQLFDRAYGHFIPIDRAWQRQDGRFVDPFRPQIEPAGFACEEDVVAATILHLSAVRNLFEQMDVFVFTLGLTECWQRIKDGAVFPLAPGVVAGAFDPAHYEFVNLSAVDVMEDMRGAVQRIRSINNNIRFLFTVSPVPLIATYEDRHVLVSTIESKSKLRAAIGQVAADDSEIDYFPSYEVIIGNHARGDYFAADLRSVTEEGVSHVSHLFFKHYTEENLADSGVNGPNPLSTSFAAQIEEQRQLQEIVCDEEAIERHRL